MRLLTPEPAPINNQQSTNNSTSAFPLKSFRPSRPSTATAPSFTLATINPVTATLVDYTVIQASNPTGIDTTWAPEYTYSAAYQQPAFDSAALTALIAGFAADPIRKTAASQAYLATTSRRRLRMLQLVWPQYICSMDHDSGAAFAACACAR